MVGTRSRFGGEIATTAATYQRLGVLPFDHERQLALGAGQGPAGQSLLVTKGAPEVVLDRCVSAPDGLGPALEALFSEGARVVAVAERPLGGKETHHGRRRARPCTCGFLTFADRPKADAGASIAQLQRLGVEVKIITGDNGLVAAKVCSDIGVDCAGVLSGAEVESLDDDQLAAAIPTTTVFARISPEQKSRIIKVARRTGKDVAFLGDGVNDAVALHHADVGISVDSGTDVAKDAADVVLLDKDLGVLADGVMEGRRIFANTMKYVLMATSSNFGNMFSAAGASVFLSFLPMLPVADPAQQPALQHRAAGDPDRPGRSRGAGPASGVGHEVHPQIHGRVRPRQLDLRLHHLLGDALRATRRPHRVQDRLVRRVDRHANPCRVRDPDARVPFVKSRPSLPMLLVPTGAAVLGAVLPYTGTGPRCWASHRCRRPSSCCCSGWWSSTYCWSSLQRPGSTAPPRHRHRDLQPTPPNGWKGTSDAARPASSATQPNGGTQQPEPRPRMSLVEPKGRFPRNLNDASGGYRSRRLASSE